MELHYGRERRLYAHALYATRPAGGETAEDEREHEVYLRVALALAADEDEARAKMMARLLELCPPSEGWANHHITLGHVTKEALREMLAAVSDDRAADDQEDNSQEEGLDSPELLM
jgi:hypothetical protein